MSFADLAHRRWSPRAFTPRPVEPDEVRAVFDAARFAQSSYNEQPWAWVAATKEDGEARARLESYLVDGNAFAKDAWLLAVSFAKGDFDRNGKQNVVAKHDLGAANQIIALAAFDLGLATRFMVGFDRERAKELAPDARWLPTAMLCLGHPTEQARAAGPGDRDRRPLEQALFRGEWGSAF